MARRRTQAPEHNAPAPGLETIWSQEPLNRRETYEAPRTLVEEIPIVGQISLQRAVPHALGPDSHPNEFEIHLVRDGRMRLWIDSPDCVLDLHGGMASLTRPGQVHSAEGELILPGRWMWMRFTVPVGKRQAMPGLSIEETVGVRKSLMALKSQLFHFSPALEHCMERIISEHRHPTPESALVVRSALHELIVWILRDHRADQRQERGSVVYSPPIARSIDWLRNHLDQNISVSELAEVAGVCASYLRRCFHHEVGSSPSDYISQMRIEQSKRLLLETNQSITQVAMAMGYSTSTYFAAAFHRETGTTPTEFRKQFRGSVSDKPKPSNGQRFPRR
jgi:AraC-like DNA-binding protein/mannose-6-phosphate isomerase-like protein (cupin superfamily)